jgi:glycerol-3-phosphate acyltransferase PlsY
MSGISHTCIFFVLAGFLSGSVMYSYILPKLLCGVDVRDASPDRNPGGANAIRSAGVGLGLVCILLDILKAFIPVYIAVTYAGIRGFWLAPVVAAPVFGHAFSPFLKFRGGKSVSTFYGALLALWPVSRIVLLPAVAMVVFRFLITVHPDSLCVFVSLLTSCCALFFFEPDPFLRGAFLLTQAVVFYRTVRNPDEGRPEIRIGRRTFPLLGARPGFRRL